MAFNSQNKQYIDVKEKKFRFTKVKTAHFIPYNHVQT